MARIQRRRELNVNLSNFSSKDRTQPQPASHQPPATPFKTAYLSTSRTRWTCIPQARSTYCARHRDSPALHATFGDGSSATIDNQLLYQAGRSSLQLLRITNVPLRITSLILFLAGFVPKCPVGTARERAAPDRAGARPDSIRACTR